MKHEEPLCLLVRVNLSGFEYQESALSSFLKYGCKVNTFPLNSQILGRKNGAMLNRVAAKVRRFAQQ